MFNINGISILNNLRTISSYQETRLCGFVIYDETDAVMKRVMNDSNIFRMLDDISGPRWPIFTVSPLLPSRCGAEGDALGAYGMAKRVIKPDMNKKIFDFFGLNGHSDAPCFVVFCWDDNGNLINARYKIDNSLPSNAEDSLTNIVKIVSQAEAKLIDTNRKDLNAYRNAIYSLEKFVYISTIKKRLNLVKTFSDFIGCFI